jgi:hypothetical protein
VAFITILREPVARALSEFNDRDNQNVVAHRNQWPRVPVGGWEYVDAWQSDRNFSLQSFMRCGACQVGISNRQTRMLGMSGANLSGAVTETVYRTALANLRNMVRSLKPTTHGPFVCVLVGWGGVRCSDHIATCLRRRRRSSELLSASPIRCSFSHTPFATGARLRVSHLRH